MSVCLQYIDLIHNDLIKVFLLKIRQLYYYNKK